MILDPSRKAPEKSFLTGGGQLGEIIAAFDWSATPLGPIETWPTSLKTTVALILRSPVPIVTLWGEQGTMIYNDAYSVFAANRHPKLLGSAVREGWPEVADFNDNIMKVVLAGGTLSYRDFGLVLYRSGAAENVWMNLDYSPVIGESGRPIGVIAIVVEITEAHNAIASLKENESRLKFLDALAKETAKRFEADAILEITTRMVGEHLNVAVCAYADMDADQNGFTIRGDWAAPGAAHIVGHYSLADFGKLAVERLGAGKPLVINDNLKELPPEEAATFQGIGIGATICMPLVKEGVLTALMAIHHKGPHVWTDYELALITEVTERSWAHIERVRSEAEMREGEQRFVHELEKQVAERTADVKRAEEALQQALKLEAIGNLTGGIAHDFNNLLMAVLGSLELLRKRMPEDSGLLRLLDIATEGARRGKSLTERMLAFARKQDLKPQRTDLGRLVGGMAELMERALGPTITVDIRIDNDLSQVEIDPNQLEAALLNLAVNARDAMHGEGPLVIQAHEEDLLEPRGALVPGTYVCLSVVDAGEGMDADTLRRATEPFFTTKGVGKGTGLGLSMVHGLAEQSGGTLMLKSVPGVGTTAEIWLPAAGHAPSEAVELAAAVILPAPATAARLAILAVDDDPLILMNMVDMLEDLGHSVVEAPSAKIALDQLGKAKFDLLVTDHAMPHMTGSQLIKEAKARFPELPVILATGYADLPPGANADVLRLSKPFSQADLAAILAEASRELNRPK